MGASIWAPSVLMAAVLNMTVVTDSQWGAVGDGVNDDTAAINAALASDFDTIFLNGDHLITSQIVLPAGGKKKLTALSPESGKLICRATSFTGAANTSTGRAVYLAGTTGGGVIGIGITMDTYTDNLAVIGVNLEGCTDTYVQHCDIYGFSKAEGLVNMNTCVRCNIDNNDIHDCYTDSATTGQITGINADDDKIAGVGSSACSVTNNRIYNLNVGPIFQGLYNYQTDAINLQSGGTGWKVEGNICYNIGEAIDIYCSDSLINGNIITNCFLTGIKVIHGASKNEICNNKIRRCDYYGIQVAGSNVSGVGDIEGNHIHGNSITEMDPNNRRATTGSACIQTDNAGYTFQPVNNTFENNVLDPTPNAYFAIYRGSSGTGNVYLNNRILATGLTARVGTAGSETGRVLDALPTDIVAYNNGAQAVPTGAATVLVFNTEVRDARGEFASNTYTAQIPGSVDVEAATRLAGLIAGTTQVRMIIYKNGAAYRETDVVCNSADQTFTVSGPVEVVAGDTVDVRCFQNSGADRNTTAGLQYNFISIRAN